jgi:tRNA(Ile)-lysidine synthase
MNKTEQNILKFIEEQKMISTGDKILVALSGGPDSVFLLNFLFRFRRKFKISLAAFHLNHMLRKKDADKDELFCRQLCESLKIVFFSRKIDVKTAALKEKVSIEEAGRKLRYSILEEIASENGYSKIATAHNIEDNTETVLLNLIKGTGMKGISGIPHTRGKIIRPLLSTSKKDIIKYLSDNNLEYMTDLSNLKNNFERNYLRNKVIPLISGRLNPDFDNAVFRSSRIFKNIAAYIGEKTSGFENIAEKEGDSVVIPVEKLSAFDSMLVPEILRNIIERNFLTQLTFNDIVSVYSLLDKKTGRSADLPGRITVLKERAFLRIFRKKPFLSNELKISTGNHYLINGRELFITLWNGKVNFGKDKDVEFISGDEIGEDLIVRQWKAGDKFNPIGMKGTVKVSDFLNSLKIPSSEKKKKLVLTDNKEIIWVIGYRINEKFKIKPDTRKIIKLCLK